MAVATLHLNNSKDLDLLLGFLHLPPKILDISKKKQHGYVDKKAPVMVKAEETSSGLLTVAKELAKIAGKLNNNLEGFLGLTSFEEAEIQQWLHYCETNLKPCDVQELKYEAECLNKYLGNLAFFVGNHFSLADLVIFQALHPFMATITFAEKEKLIHLSRWYMQIQNIPGTRHKFPAINFHMTKLY